MSELRSFASDNNAGIHPSILAAIQNENRGHAYGYGSDTTTEKALAKVKEAFGPDCDAIFVGNGTAANVLALGSVLKSYESILCADLSHVYLDECGAAEKLLGSKLIPISAPGGKLTIAALEEKLKGRGEVHHVQPRVVSITQTTELGTVYTIPEIRTITDWAHRQGLLVHMDGARVFNAAVSLGVSLKQMVSDAGIDVLSLGGTKNGLMGAEAVISFGKNRHPGMPYLRKQMMQLISKMRFISAQYLALFSDELWRENALHANQMAKRLAHEIRKIPEISILYPVEANAIFARVPSELIQPLQAKFLFHVWDEGGDLAEAPLVRPIVRWMTSFDTTTEDVARFVSEINVHVKNN